MIIWPPWVVALGLAADVRPVSFGLAIVTSAGSGEPP